MSGPNWNRVKEIFGDALELPSDQRAAFVDQACGADVDLQAEVRSLLAEADDGRDDFLETPAATVLQPPNPEIGSTIGSYVIRSVIGEGGMGRVFEATQEHPHRTVALKVLRPGYFNAGAERRFQWEVEALGRLSHAGIAAVHDAGVESTADGHSVSWFAMAKVDGKPLLQAAADLQLDREGRIRLLLRVADAVAHAHQRGVIHRDLKPDNILVDESGQPHVLDFGIARALDPVETSLTSAGEIIGTIAYMSPEQVLGEPDRVDVRSDVYALGVLLFQLLTGESPLELSGLSLPKAALRLAQENAAPASRFDRSRDANQFLVRVLQGADPEIVGREVRVVDLLQQASLELGVTEAVRSGSAEGFKLPSVAKGLDPAVLAGLHFTIGETYLRLESLDYARTHLEEAYRAFVDANGQASDGAMSAAGSLTELWLQNSDLERAMEFFRKVDGGAELRGDTAPPWLQMRPLELSLLFHDARSERPEKLAAAREVFEGWLGLRSPGDDSVEVARSMLANALVENGDDEAADDLLQEGIAAMKALEGDAHPRLLTQELTRAQIANGRAEWQAALAILERLMPRALFVWGPDHADMQAVKAAQASALTGIGRHDEAIAVMEDVLARSLRAFGDGHENTFVARNNLSVALMYQKRFARAEEILRESLASLDGERDPIRVLQCEMSLAAALENLDRLDESLQMYEAAQSSLLELADESHPQTLITRNNMTSLFIKLDRASDGVSTARSVLQLSEEHQPESRLNVFPFRSNLGRALQAAGDYEGAEEAFLEVEEKLRADAAATSVEIARIRSLLVELYTAWGQPKRADPWRDE